MNSCPTFVEPRSWQRVWEGTNSTGEPKIFCTKTERPPIVQNAEGKAHAHSFLSSFVLSFSPTATRFGECCPRSCDPNVDVPCVPEASCLCTDSNFVTLWGSPNDGGYDNPLMIDLDVNWRENIEGCQAGPVPDFTTCVASGGIVAASSALYKTTVARANFLRLSIVTGNPSSQLQVDALSCVGIQFNASTTDHDCSNVLNCVDQVNKRTCCCSACHECNQRFPCVRQTPGGDDADYPSAFALQFSPPYYEFSNISSPVFNDYWCGEMKIDPSFPTSLIPSARRFQCTNHGTFC